MIKLEENFKEMKEEVFAQMSSREGKNYKWFLRAVRAFKYLSFNPTRGKFFEGYYTLMRHIDDIVDGDALLPKGYNSAVEYVVQKIDFAENPTNPKDPADYLMIYCFELADQFGEDFSSETQDIMGSMLFDARRIGQRIIFPEETLKYHFHLLDIMGTVRGSLKVYGEDPDKYPVLEPLGISSRIYYNLRDYDEDIGVGFVNIPAEDCEKHKISSFDLENRLSRGVQEWFLEQANLGLSLIEQHRKNLAETEFGLLTRMTFPVVYERSARKYFEKVINNSC